ncbi:MAG: hypothetical protein IH852_12075 [Bacteroidetes bacterium]|nr:hypothetical protein [Bacteroidota bacterium]
MEAVYIMTRYVLQLLRGVLALALVLTLSSCSEEEPTGPEEEEVIEIDPGGNPDLEVDEGYIGVVIDARQIVKKGYFPTEAQISFPGYSRFNTSLPINASTNLTILDIHNTELSEEEKNAFANGVTVNIVIRDATQLELATYDGILELNDSNLPLSLTTALPYIPPPVKIDEGIPFLLQREGSEGVITSSCYDCFETTNYLGNDGTQQFYFTPSGAPDTYYISHLGYAEGIWWYILHLPIPFSETGFVSLRGGVGGTVLGEPDEFVLEQDEDGWVRIKHKETGYYVQEESTLLKTNTFGGDRFRLISDHIDWEIEDRGTVYHQPIMPPAQLDFAYLATLRNCSSATLEETVGRTESRSWSTTIGTTESLELFSGNTYSAGLTVGVEVSARVGNNTTPFGGGVTFSAEASVNYEYTTQTTTTTASTWSSTEETTIEVSRIRTLTVPPFTAVEIYDAIETVKNIKVPFTQELRIRATDTQNNNASLSGEEIVTQMLFNFVEGVVSNVGSDFIDITFRGNATMTELFNGYTDVNELENACN